MDLFTDRKRPCDRRFFFFLPEARRWYLNSPLMADTSKVLISSRINAEWPREQKREIPLVFAHRVVDSPSGQKAERLRIKSFRLS